MSEALAQRAETLRVNVPREVWRRGKRPGRGQFFRVSFALTFVLLGIGMPGLHLKIALMAVGLIAFAMLPVFTDSRLARMENEVQWADRAQAAKLLETLEQRRLVALFAPFAWVQLQKGRLHLRLGDGRGAARAFAEAARLCGQPEQPALVSGQAHGLTLSGDRKEAQALLRTLEKRDALSPYDRLNLGINLIEDGRAKAATEHLERAAEALDQHPRALSAYALALAKSDRIDEALEVFERAEAIEDLGDDPLAPDLLKRARKALRSADAGKSAKRGESTASPKAKAKKPVEKKRKKDKRKERRERRKGKPAEATELEQPEVETRGREGIDTEREKAEREKAEREKTEREKTEREKAEREKAEREKAEREEAEREKATREKAEREKAEREKAEREKAERDKVEREKAAALPKPPEIVFDGDKPVFRPPAIPPPPKLQGTPKAPPVVPPAVAPAADDKPKDDWGDLFGNDDDAPIAPVPASGKKTD